MQTGAVMAELWHGITLLGCARCHRAATAASTHFPFAAHCFPFRLNKPRWNYVFLPFVGLAERPYWHIMIFLSNCCLWLLIGEHILHFNKYPAGQISWSSPKYLVQCTPSFARELRTTVEGQQQAWLKQHSRPLNCKVNLVFPTNLAPEGCWPRLVIPMCTLQVFSVLSPNMSQPPRDPSLRGGQSCRDPSDPGRSWPLWVQVSTAFAPNIHSQASTCRKYFWCCYSLACWHLGRLE